MRLLACLFKRKSRFNQFKRDIGSLAILLSDNTVGSYEDSCC
jgi:hypothetical protein